MKYIKWIKNNYDYFCESLKKRNIPIDNLQIDVAIEKYNVFIENKKKLDTFIMEQNKAFKQKIYDNKYGKEIDELKTNIKILDEELTIIALKIPNILLESVPYGTDSSHNKVIYEWGEKRGSVDHSTLLNKQLMGKVNNMSGSRFIGLQGKLLELYFAIERLCLDYLINLDYNPIYLPHIVNKKGFEQSGQLPFFEKDLFSLEDRGYLIPTSEVSIANTLVNDLYDYKDLPRKICCFSPCYRKEAGAAGNVNRGLIRLHQFNKIEIFQISSPGESDKVHMQMVDNIGNLLKMLNLPHRLVLLCGGDTGNHSAKTYDFEVWYPSKNQYIEISSCSNIHNFQSTRLNCKYKDRDSVKDYVHTLNGSCLPLERTLGAIMECYSKDNTISVPDCLKKYLRFNHIDFSEL